MEDQDRNRWEKLEERLQTLKGSRVMVIYDVGHGNSMVNSILEQVGPDFLKLVGYYPLGYIQIKEIRQGEKVVFSTLKEEQK